MRLGQNKTAIKQAGPAKVVFKLRKDAKTAKPYKQVRKLKG